MTGDVTPYVKLITSEHAGAQRFVSTVGATVQPLADEIAVMRGMPALFDIDSAVGAQLDAVGLWVGVGRFVASTMFSDDQYRALLRARIARNHWDGSIPGAYAVWDQLFAGQNHTVYVIDYQDMSMDLGLVEPGAPDPVTLALLTGNYISLRPAGVLIRGYYYPAVSGPEFWWDTETSTHKGWDEGSWLGYVPLG